jgi:hypothetical protein
MICPKFRTGLVNGLTTICRKNGWIWIVDKAPGINMAESLLGPPLQHLGIHLVLPSNCPRDMPTMLLHYLRGCRGNYQLKDNHSVSSRKTKTTMTRIGHSHLKPCECYSQNIRTLPSSCMPVKAAITSH